MSFKNIGFRLGIVVLFVTVGFLLAIQLFEDNEISAEGTITCRYKGGFGGTYFDVVYDGEYLYAAHAQGLSIFDVSDPSEPEEIGFVHTAGGANPPDGAGVAVAGNYAYVADGDNGLVIVDITDKTDPQKVGGYDTTCYAYDVAVVGGYAYVADGYNGLVIMDITDKTDPQEVGHYDTAVWANGVAVAGDYAYVIDRVFELVIVDISDKCHPHMAGYYDTAGDTRGVAVAGDYAYVAEWNDGLAIVDISDKRNPQKTGRYDTAGFARGVAVASDYAYVADASNGLVIVDISNKSNPQRTGSYDTAGDPRGVAVAGNYAYVADDDNGLVIVDIKDKTDPQKTGGYDTAGNAHGVAVAGDYAYVADGGKGLVIVNIKDKTNPQKTGRYDTCYAVGIAVDGDYAYVADGGYDYGGLVIVDIRDKTDPRRVGGYNTAGYARGVAVAGDYAYVADDDNGLVIVDITDKTDPQEVGYYDTAGKARDVAVAGDYAYVADGDKGLVIMDITDKTNPQEAGHYDTAGWASGVAVAGDYAYVAGRNLLIVDITDKTDPQEVGGYNTSGDPCGVAVADDYAYVADLWNGPVIVDITNKTNPQEMGHYDSNWAQGVAVAGDYAYVADDAYGLVIVEMIYGNNPPKNPTSLSGKNNGELDTYYLFTTTTTDPEGDKIRYTFDWGDDKITTTNLLSSGTSVEESHSWDEEGTYYVRVKAEDEYGAQSNWSEEFGVTISKGSKQSSRWSKDEITVSTESLLQSRKEHVSFVDSLVEEGQFGAFSYIDSTVNVIIKEDIDEVDSAQVVLKYEYKDVITGEPVYRYQPFSLKDRGESESDWYSVPTSSRLKVTYQGSTENGDKKIYTINVKFITLKKKWKDFIAESFDSAIPFFSYIMDFVDQQPKVSVDSVIINGETIDITDVKLEDADEILDGKRKNAHEIGVNCPVDIEVYDRNGNLMNHNEGVIYTGEDSEPEFVIIGNPEETNYTIKVTGTDDGTYTLIARSIENGKVIDEKIEGNLSISKDETQEKSVTLKIPQTVDEDDDEFILFQNVGPLPLIVYVGVAAGLVIVGTAVVTSKKKKRQKGKQISGVYQRPPQFMAGNQQQAPAPSLPDFQAQQPQAQQQPSQHQMSPQPQHSPQSQQPIPQRHVPPRVKCPKCSTVIQVDHTNTTPEGKVRITCPNCGVSGTL